MGKKSSKDAMETVAKREPLAAQSELRSHDLEPKLPKPSFTQATAAPDVDNVNGTSGRKYCKRSVLQKHAAFFDLDRDGIVYPWDTLRALRAMGFNLVAAFIFAIFGHVAMSYKTLPTWIPSPFLPIYIQNIHKARHRSDSRIYDPEGRFNPANLENIFSKYACTERDKLSFRELWRMTDANRSAFDFLGWISNKFEWGVLYLLARDEKGFLSKEAVRRCFDGSLFQYYAKRQKNAAS